MSEIAKFMSIGDVIKKVMGCNKIMESPNDKYQFKPPQPFDNKDDLFIIGAGYGRTGTSSLQMALCALGFRCYHAREVFNNLSDEKLITKAAQTKRKKMDDLGIKSYTNNMDKCLIDYDWNKIFRQSKNRAYTATVDHPLNYYYLELMKYYPNYKVILTVRDDADKWYTSAISSIYKIEFIFAQVFFIKLRNLLFGISSNHPMWVDLNFGYQGNGEICKKNYNEWIEEVKRTVPKEKLLVFNVKQGWDPLCKFLNVEKPKEMDKFPRANEKGEWVKFLSRLQIVVNIVNFVTVAAVAAVLYYVFK